MSKLKKTIILIVCLIIIAGLFFYPQKILNKDDDIMIHFIQYNPHFGSAKAITVTSLTEIYGYDKDLIIECLSQYRKQRTLCRSTGCQLKDIEYEIHLNVNGKPESIVLGNKNYESSGNGSLKKRILNSEKLRAELSEILNTYKVKEL